MRFAKAILTAVFLFIILWVLILATSCRSTKIITKEKEVTITDTIYIHDTITVPGDSGVFKSHIDSLTMALRTIFNDSLLTVWAQLDTVNKGMIIYKYKIKERLVPYEKKVYYEKKVVVPCDCPEPHEHKWWELLFFWVGVTACGLAIISLIMYIKR